MLTYANLIDVCSWRLNREYISFGSGNASAPNSRQGVICTNDNSAPWRLDLSSGPSVFQSRISNCARIIFVLYNPLTQSTFNENYSPSHPTTKPSKINKRVNQLTTWLHNALHLATWQGPSSDTLYVGRALIVLARNGRKCHICELFDCMGRGSQNRRQYREKGFLIRTINKDIRMS